MKEEIQNLNNMIDEYVEFQTELAVAKNTYQMLEAEYARLENLLSNTSGVAMWAHVTNQIASACREVDDQRKQAKAVYESLQEKAKGFENFRRDVTEETLEGMQL